MAIFIVHYYGGILLGERRFEIAMDIANTAIRHFRAALRHRCKRLERSNSQQSLASDISYAISAAEESQEEIEETAPKVQSKVYKHQQVPQQQPESG